MGVGALPDNLAACARKHLEQIVGSPDESSQALKIRGFQRSISDSGVSIGNPLSMKRQLQISFSKLDEFENAFQVN
jgi:hypothetical protein